MRCVSEIAISIHSRLQMRRNKDEDDEEGKSNEQQENEGGEEEKDEEDVNLLQRSSGIIINTPGWVVGKGLELRKKDREIS